MNKLTINHFERQKKEDGTYPEKLYFLLGEEKENNEVCMTLINFSSEEEVPEYEFVKYATDTNTLPYVKK